MTRAHLNEDMIEILGAKKRRKKYRDIKYK